MNELLEFLEIEEKNGGIEALFARVSHSLIDIAAKIDWLLLFKTTAILLISMVLTGLLLYLIDIIFDHYGKRRVRTHHLTISNKGNAPSIFLLRSIDMPKTLAVRFRIDGEPMIWVTYVPKKNKAESNAAASQPAEKPVDEENEHEAELIPDLNAPIKKAKQQSSTVKDSLDHVVKSADAVGRKAGFFASILGTIVTLLPFKIPGLQDAQSSLKNFQQETNTAIGTINTKVNAANTLADQVVKLPGVDKLSSAAQNVGADASKALSSPQSVNAAVVDRSSPQNDLNVIGGDVESGSILSNEFVYDEEVWKQNIGKVDENNGSLNYAQSKVLEPGESMKIDLELMNLSDSPSAVSHLYKIEVRQVLLSRMHLSAPTRFVSGIVIFHKVSRLDRILPSIWVIGLVVFSIQLISLFSYLIF